MRFSYRFISAIMKKLAGRRHHRGRRRRDYESRLSACLSVRYAMGMDGLLTYLTYWRVVHNVHAPSKAPFIIIFVLFLFLFLSSSLMYHNLSTYTRFFTAAYERDSLLKHTTSYLIYSVSLLRMVSSCILFASMVDRYNMTLMHM